MGVPGALCAWFVSTCPSCQSCIRCKQNINRRSRRTPTSCAVCGPSPNTLAFTNTVASSVAFIENRKSASGAALKAFALVEILSLCLVSSSCFAQSSRWVEVGGNDDITAYADTQSMRRTGPKVKVWLKWVNASPVETSTVFPKKTFLSEKSLGVYHCTDRSFTTLQVIRYANADSTGGVVESLDSQDTQSTYRDIAPETIGESILNYVCKATASAKK